MKGAVSFFIGDVEIYVDHAHKLITQYELLPDIDDDITVYVTNTNLFDER